MTPPLAIALLCTVVPASFGRLWLIWWKSACAACGHLHSGCECPPDGPIMRPRR